MRILGIILVVLFGLPFLAFSWIALSSLLGRSADLHGYGVIFGTLGAMTLAIPVALVVPLLFPRGTRAKALLGSLATLLVMVAGLFLALVIG